MPLLKSTRKLLPRNSAGSKAMAIIAAFALFGLGLLVRSAATAYHASTEAEYGSISGNATKCPDNQASGSQTVRFGFTSCDNVWPKFKTPIMPFEPGGNIAWHDGWYYVPVKLGSEPRIRMARAQWIKDFGFIKDEAAIVSQPVVWDAAGSPVSGYVNWPVALYKLRGKWYIYMNAARNNPPNFSDRLHVLESSTDSPMGPWVYKGQVGQNTWSIGFAPFEWEDKLYVIVSNREGHSDGTHHSLAIAEMSSPWTTTTNWTTLTDPIHEWETWSPSGPWRAPINEVDQPVTHNGKLHVFYSASHVTSPNYAAGVITYTGSGRLLDRDNWTKRPTPILSRTAQTAGPGQTFTLKSPDGSRDYLGYAYWRTPTQLSPRPLGLMPISWDANDHPVLGPPPDPGTSFDEPPKPY